MTLHGDLRPHACHDTLGDVVLQGRGGEAANYCSMKPAQRVSKENKPKKNHCEAKKINFRKKIQVLLGNFFS
jgi:hypothetical protein